MVVQISRANGNFIEDTDNDDVNHKERDDVIAKMMVTDILTVVYENSSNRLDRTSPSYIKHYHSYIKHH